MSKRRNRDDYYDYEGSSRRTQSRSRHYSSSDESTSEEDVRSTRKDKRYRPASDEERSTSNKHSKIEPKKDIKTTGIRINLGPPKSVTEPKPKIAVASVFNQDSDEEPEEMPKEARMKMRNIGRDTPTSAGPNSFGKTKHGFCNSKRSFDKSAEDASKDDKE